MNAEDGRAASVEASTSRAEPSAGLVAMSGHEALGAIFPCDVRAPQRAEDVSSHPESVFEAHSGQMPGPREQEEHPQGDTPLQTSESSSSSATIRNATTRRRFFDYNRNPRSDAAPSLTEQATSTLGRRVRGNRDGAESDESMPSLQTVSDTSDEDLLDSESESEDDDDEDDDDEDLDDEDDEGLDDFDDYVDGPPLPGDSLRAFDMLSAVDQLLPAESDWLNSQLPINVPNEQDNRGTISSVAEYFGFASAEDAAAAASIRPPTGRSAIALLNSLSMAMRSSGRSENDTIRADIIMKALEEVPETLVRRYETLRQGTKEEESDGCAVCRDTLLQDNSKMSLSQAEVFFAELPFNELAQADVRILAFPCPGMHLFHAGCIAPWLGRKTTCPTCRFDVDPESLTLSERRNSSNGRTLKAWSPPKNKGFKEWLELQEKKKKNSDHLPALQDVEASSYSYDDEADDEDDGADFDLMEPLNRSADAAGPMRHIRARAGRLSPVVTPLTQEGADIEDLVNLVQPADALFGITPAMRAGLLSQLSPERGSTRNRMDREVETVPPLLNTAIPVPHTAEDDLPELDLDELDPRGSWFGNLPTTAHLPSLNSEGDARTGSVPQPQDDPPAAQNSDSLRPRSSTDRQWDTMLRDTLTRMGNTSESSRDPTSSRSATTSERSRPDSQFTRSNYPDSGMSSRTLAQPTPSLLLAEEPSIQRPAEITPDEPPSNDASTGDRFPRDRLAAVTHYLSFWRQLNQ